MKIGENASTVAFYACPAMIDRRLHETASSERQREESEFHHELDLYLSEATTLTYFFFAP
jgi:hypothetical protein